MKRLILSVVLGALMATSGAAATTHTFAVENGEFRLDGKPFVIRCGEMHLARVPCEYWRHRLKMIRACGFNAVCAYLFWNYHEQVEGKLDFKGEKDVAGFCKIAQEEGLWVVLRPGPYTCAEWDFGGHPWWLLKREGIRLRSTDPKYLEPAKRYLAAVGRELAPLQVTKGGPILMVQAENEYGSYGDDANYMRAIAGAIKAAGFEVPIFACNGRGVVKRGYVPELVQVVNFGSDPAAGFAELRSVSPTSPLMCGEFYPAWFDSWGKVHHVKSADDCLRDLSYMLEHKASFSMYMAHGGTTFAWWAGCNAPFVPEVSSYDYDAPISEAGWTTPKFFALRTLFGKHLNPGEAIPEPPKAIPVQSGKAALVGMTGDLFALAASLPRIESEAPITFEKAGLGYGIAVYEATIPAGAGGPLVADVRDLGVVRLDGKVVGYLDRRRPKAHVTIPRAGAARKLEILVEPMGRYNFGEMMHQGMKGIVGGVSMGGAPLTGWKTAYLTYDDCADKVKYGKEGPLGDAKGVTAAGAVHRLVLKMSKGADTFLDMSGFRKGLVRVNGHWLGRYWAIGPTQTMFVPGCWLKEGDNEVIILDTVGSELGREATIAWSEKPILDVLVPDNDFRSSDGVRTRFGIEAWEGAKVAFLGDSITDKCHVGCKKNYWNFLIDDLKLDAKVYGINGDNWKGIPNQVNKINESMDVDLDAIFVFMGTNDYMGGIPLGEMFTYAQEETNLWGKKTVLRRRHFNRDLSTFFGRVNVGLETIKSEFPEAQVVLLTPIHRAFFTCSPTNVQPPESFPNATGHYVDEYVEALRTAARHWSVPVIDLYAESGLLPENDNYIRYFANSKRDRLHPNTSGHRRLADVIEARLNAIPAGFRR